MNSTFKASDDSKISSKQVIQILLGVILLATCAQIAIPLKPVPITLQTIIVMLIALLYDRQTAIIIILSYLIAGIIGMPIFANFKSGFHSIMGPTGGYLFGFIPAVLIMTSLKDYYSHYTFWGSLTNCTIGTIIIYICGLSVLSIHIGFESAIRLGLLPFIIPGFIKAVLLALCLKTVGILKYKK